MPTIDPTKIPTVQPGRLFSQFTGNTSLAIRWITSRDPAYFEALNRPLSDMAMRELIMAKTIDTINLRLGHQSLFPFLVQPRVIGGSGEVDVPPSWIYDMHVSIPSKWENVRLAKIKRIAGVNSPDYTGKLRLVFSANVAGSTTEVYIIQADYDIDSVLGYQQVRISVPSSSDETSVVSQSESATIEGFIYFRTLDLTDTAVTDFLDGVAPPLDVTDGNSDGLFDTPAEYEMSDEPAGSADITNDYTLVGLSHGTGLLLPVATNAIPPADSDVDVWVNTFNYPFDSEVTLLSTSPSGIEIPKGLFREFNIVAPSSDEPTGDNSGAFYPVYISRIVREDVSADTLTVYFATYNVESPSIVPVEFATLTISRTDAAGTLLPIVPIDNLWTSYSGDLSWLQGFGTGYVILSSKWEESASVVTDFFDSFIAVTGSPAAVVFAKANTRISSYGISRMSKTTPTVGQASALLGSKDGITSPSSTNRYIVEADQGLGETVDFSVETSLPANKRTHAAIERYGHKGGMAHRVVSLVIDAEDSTLDYNADVLPRLIVLYGRSPIFGDFWWDGTRLKFFNGSTFVG